MNDKKAKKLRCEVYGDVSLRVERRYIMNDGVIRNLPGSPRATYQEAKRRLKNEG